MMDPESVRILRKHVCCYDDAEIDEIVEELREEGRAEVRGQDNAR